MLHCNNLILKKKINFFAKNRIENRVERWLTATDIVGISQGATLHCNNTAASYAHAACSDNGCR